ncbi:MAG: glycosyltransferase [Prevotellaceae bacterium]|jgi:glycosyltransferase involved in cell wall biosynthesis|nr:glycosyltransferase [Prevotellaceae bacterium]
MAQLSVIIPIYGVEKYIERCARSLFEQTMKDAVEYIFVDDCTPDRSIEILESVFADYPNRKEQVKIIRHTANQGQAGTRNTGLANASGEYIGFVDSDDYVEPYMFATLVRKAIDTNADVVRTGSCYKHSGKLITEQKLSDFSSKKECIVNILGGKYMACLWGGIYKKNIFADNNIFFLEGVNFCEDYAVLPRVLYYAANIVYVDKPLYHYIDRIDSTTRRINKKHIEDMIVVYRAIDAFFLDKNDIYKETIAQTKASTMICLVAELEDADMQKKTFATFENIDYFTHYHGLSAFCKILYIMEKHNMWGLLRLFMKILKIVNKIHIKYNVV